VPDPTGYATRYKQANSKWRKEGCGKKTGFLALIIGSEGEETF
jgi:hypothetical protein